jgi:hypothetical protein
MIIKIQDASFWGSEIAQVRSEIGILTYSQGDRIMIIKIEDASFWGSEIEMIASPVTKKD